MEIKEFIKKYLINKSNQPNRKACREEWFEIYNHIDKLESIKSMTNFLPTDANMSQRIWHIINDVSNTVLCKVCGLNQTSYAGFSVGYRKTCSNTCAQHDTDTMDKIKTTNMKKYGSEYPLTSIHGKDMTKKTMLLKYGVENPSHSKILNDKKKKTCLKNFGVEWILSDQIRKEQSVFKKHGVNNCQKIKSIREKSGKTRKGDFYDLLLNSNRLKNKANPLFTKDEYINSTGVCSQLKFECCKCKNTFECSIEDGDLPRCDVCHKNMSYFQTDILDIIKKIIPGEEILSNVKTILSEKKELDIYIPSRKLAIECDGLIWHSEKLGKDKNYHLNKTLECEKLGIHLIHIFEDEWNLKPDIVESKLKSIMGFKEDTIYARKCKIEEILDNDVKRNFLELNHIQGDDINSKYKFGLFYNDELCALMTFSKINSRIFIKHSENHTSNGEYELVRYCSNKNVIGGASKLLSHFIKTINPKKIISYADRRWTKKSKNLYQKIGFSLVSDGSPNYYYFGNHKGYKRLHRFNFRKSVLKNKLKTFDENLTECENMELNGYNRIWDCGHLKYEMTF